MNDIEASRIGLERWKPAYGFHGLYDVSNLGRVRSVVRRGINKNRLYGGKLLKASVDAYGYPRVSLSLKRSGLGIKYEKVFILVYKSFIGPYYDQLLRHLDDDKTNSRLYNLKPGSYKDNLHDAFRNGRNEPFGDRQPNWVI